LKEAGARVVATVKGRPAVLGRRALLVELGVDTGAESVEDASQVGGVGWAFLGRLVLPTGHAQKRATR
jgi:hypothetical protein